MRSIRALLRVQEALFLSGGQSSQLGERVVACESEYCIYDETHEDYIYTRAWVEKLATALGNPAEYEQIVGHPPN